MFKSLEAYRPFLVLSVGAIAGSLIRVYLTSFFSSIFSAKHWATFVVNILAAFLLGLFLALSSRFGLNSFDNNSPLALFICVGFLGSLSTFSAFINDLLSLLLDHHWKQFFVLSLCSLLGGLMAALAGLAFANG